MIEESTTPQLTVLTQPPRRPPLKIILFAFLGLIVLVLAVEGIYYFRLERAKESVPPKKLQELTPGEAIPPDYEVAFKNIFNWPGWARPQGVEISGNGSTLKLLSDPDSLWLLLANENESSWLTVKGDFEIQFKGVLGEETPEGNKTGRIKFYNRREINQTDYDTIQLWVKKDSQLVLEAINGQARKLENLGGGEIPASGNLRIRFSNVGQSGGETITIFNGETGEEIIKSKLSLPFFPKDTKLSFGLEVGNGVKFLTVADFQILVPEGSGNARRM